MPPIHKYKSEKAGRNILFFGAIHGKETCGTVALKKLIEKFSDSSLQILRGSVTCVPVCNPKAFARGVRYCEENLNRIFKHHARPKSYEAKLANKLTAVADDCDVLVDLHSYGASNTPFIFLDYPTGANRQLAEAIGIPNIVTGWKELYRKVAVTDSKKASYDTVRYAYERGKISLTVECGKHHSVSAERVAFETILNTLRHFGVIGGKPSKIKTATKTFQLESMYFKESAGDVLTKHWKNFEPVSRGQVVARRANGSVIKAPYQGYTVLPKQDPPIGDEWFYLAQSN